MRNVMPFCGRYLISFIKKKKKEKKIILSKTLQVLRSKRIKENPWTCVRLRETALRKFSNFENSFAPRHEPKSKWLCLDCITLESFKLPANKQPSAVRSLHRMKDFQVTSPISGAAVE